MEHKFKIENLKVTNKIWTKVGPCWFHLLQAASPLKTNLDESHAQQVPIPLSIWLDYVILGHKWKVWEVSKAIYIYSMYFLCILR